MYVHIPGVENARATLAPLRQLTRFGMDPNMCNVVSYERSLFKLRSKDMFVNLISEWNMFPTMKTAPLKHSAKFSDVHVLPVARSWPKNVSALLMKAALAIAWGTPMTWIA
mmetsp:Transcript_94126/g.266331  ORF Transcript_94126/g.266331 Transcript_94126/m.266331 type:complete len:111 (-) Transcript_94126:1647-1979(-)